MNLTLLTLVTKKVVGLYKLTIIGLTIRVKVEWRQFRGTKLRFETAKFSFPFLASLKPFPSTKSMGEEAKKRDDRGWTTKTTTSWRFLSLLEGNPGKLGKAFPRLLENSLSGIEEFACTCAYFNKISTVMEVRGIERNKE